MIASSNSTAPTGHVALVTGGAGGIGAAICAELALDGHAVVVADLDAAAAAATAKEITELGCAAMGIAIDVTSAAAVKTALDAAAAEFGPVDILVNNVGNDTVGSFLENTEEFWDFILAVNLKGSMFTARAALPAMIESGFGRIVNIASDAGKVGSSGSAAYSAAKGGVMSLSKALAREFARNGITVNAVCPGPTQTPFLARVGANEPKLHDAMVRAIPMRRVGLPTDVAPMVAFLAGPGGGFITGQSISVSGGMTMS